jgi:hypothetical protein
MEAQLRIPVHDHMQQTWTNRESDTQIRTTQTCSKEVNQPIGCEGECDDSMLFMMDIAKWTLGAVLEVAAVVHTRRPS